MKLSQAIVEFGDLEIKLPFKELLDFASTKEGKSKSRFVNAPDTDTKRKLQIQKTLNLGLLNEIQELKLQIATIKTERSALRARISNGYSNDTK